MRPSRRNTLGLPGDHIFRVTVRGEHYVLDEDGVPCLTRDGHEIEAKLHVSKLQMDSAMVDLRKYTILDIGNAVEDHMHYFIENWQDKGEDKR